MRRLVGKSDCEIRHSYEDQMHMMFVRWPYCPFVEIGVRGFVANIGTMDKDAMCPTGIEIIGYKRNSQFIGNIGKDVRCTE